MGSWTDFDPATGITEYIHVDEVSGDITVHKEQDCTAFIEQTKALRRERHFDDGKKPENLRKFCSIPIGVQYELLWKHGIDITNRDHWPRMFYLIETEYNDCKVTDLKHGFRNGSRKVIVA